MSLIILGHGPFLDKACEVAEEIGLEYVREVLETNDGFNFSLENFFNTYSKDSFSYFVALDGRDINFSRHKLISEVRLAGYPLINLVSPSAVVSKLAKLSVNVFVGKGCIVGLESRLGLGSWLDAGVILSEKVKLGDCVTLDVAVHISEGATIGKGTSFGQSTKVLANSVIGRRCEWLIGGTAPIKMLDKTYYDSIVIEGARIL